MILIEDEVIRSVGNGEVGLHLDTAEADTVDDLESHVAGLAPGGTPGVSHDPVVHVVLSAPSDDVGGVVELGTAVGVGEDTGGVELEGELVGLDGNRHDVVDEGSLHGVGRVSGDTGVGGGLDGGGGGSIVSAGAVLGGVGVGGLVHRIVGFPVLKARAALPPLQPKQRL